MNDQERFETLQTLATQIAAHLPGWTREIPELPPHEYTPRHVFLRRDDGAGIAIAFVWNQQGRIEVSGRYPYQASGHFRDRPVITLNAARRAEALAREISRRFLPDYLVRWEEAQAEVISLQQAQNRVQYTAEQCASVTNAPLEHIRYDSGRTQATISTSVGKITVGWSGTVKIYADSLPPTLALDVLKRLMAAKAEEEPHAL